jgi:hypothetical protein
MGILFTAFALKALALAGWRLATNHGPEQTKLLAFSSTVTLSFAAIRISDRIPFPQFREHSTCL